MMINLNKKRQYCILYTTFDERHVWDVFFFFLKKLWTFFGTIITCLKCHNNKTLLCKATEKKKKKKKH